MVGPQTAYSDQLHAEKYRLPGETFRDAMGRVASALKDSTDHYHAFRDALLEQRFLPAGRVQAAMGSPKAVTPYNCYVSGSIPDSFVGRDNPEQSSIMHRAEQAADTMRMGGGIGYNFSTLRPAGAPIHKLQSRSSGPLGFMPIFNEVCKATSSAGNRRGAQMGVLRIDHPDIHAFIAAKHNSTALTGFNVSVAVTDEFMEALAAKRPFDLRFGGQVYSTVDPAELWESLMRSTWDWAEPGVLFIDRINAMNNLWYAETIAATNPCVTADTWVLTAQGARQVSDLIGKPFTALVDGKPHVSGAEGFFKTGNKQIVKLSTACGRVLRLTNDHMVMKVVRKTRYVLEKEWVRADDLLPGDEVVLHDHQAVDWAGNVDPELGYALGLLVGDGTVKDDKAVISVWTSGSSANAVAPVMERIEASVRLLPHRSDFGGWHEIVDRSEYRISTSALKDLATSFGLCRGDKTITPQIEREGSDFTARFLSGLFDADGSVQGTQQKGVSIRLGQSDVNLLQSAQRMLARLGINSVIYKNRRDAGYRMMPNGKGGASSYECKAVHDLVISGENIEVFRARIGFTDAAKASRLDDLLGSYARELNRERFTAVVQSVVPDGAEDVFDAQVPGVNAFDANGLYVHNCGEQPLPPFGACLLGSFNLVKYLARGDLGWHFDWAQLEADIPAVTRAMDNVVDRAVYPLPEQQAEAHSKRRMGLGVTGLANAAEAMGMPYGSPEFLAFEDKLLAFITRHTYLASVGLAREKGSFPLFDAERYGQGKFIQSLDADVQEQIARYGIRNSHLTSIAPTGTISMAADNVSSSIEPVYRWQQERTVLMDSGRQQVDLYDYGFGTLRVRGRRTSMGEVSATEHVDVLTTAQRHIDSAVSKTVNVTGAMDWDDFKGIYLAAYEAGAKGCTTFNKDGKRAGLFKETPEPADLPFPGGNAAAMAGMHVEPIGDSCEFDPATGRRSCE